MSEERSQSKYGRGVLENRVRERGGRADRPSQRSGKVGACKGNGVEKDAPPSVPAEL